MSKKSDKKPVKSFTMAEVAKAVGGKLTGDGAYAIERVAHPADVRGPHDLVLAMDKNLLPLLAESGAHAAVVAEEAEFDVSGLVACIAVARPRLAMAKLTNLFAEEIRVPSGVHSTAIIEDGAKIGANCAVGAMVYVCAGASIGANSVVHPHVYIGPDVEIGDGALVHAGAKIGARVKIGARSIIHFNASIGADGFSFVTPQLGSVEAAKATGAVGAVNAELVRIASLGAVEIGDDVEIGANTSIDRGTVASTRIGNGTKIDNQVQIGHNVVIGENCLICGRVGIAGSVTIGNRVVLGGAAGVADHVKIGDDVIAMAMSGIAGNVPPKTIMGGLPAKPRQRLVEEQLLLGRLKNVVKKVESLAERLDALEQGAKVD
jgi:UDP-3-O-[3-hydroxymyristoyl] glucosamine N-acyltransferase